MHRRGSTPDHHVKQAASSLSDVYQSFLIIFFRVPSLGSSLHASQGTGRGSRTKLLKEVEGGPNNRIWHRTAPRRISDSNGATMINCCMIRSAPRWVPLRWQPGLASAVQGQHVDNFEQPRLVSRGANRSGERLCHPRYAGQGTGARRSGRRNNVPDLLVELRPVASMLTKCPARVRRKWVAPWIAGNFRVRREATRCCGIGSVDSPCRCPDAAIGAEETLRDPSPSGVHGAGARVPCSASLWT